MKLIAKWTALALVAVFATAAFAADASATTKLTLTLQTERTIAGTRLAPGEYKILVQRNGDDANVRILDGKKELVNTSAKYHSQTKFVGGTALVSKRDGEVVELQSTKLKGALVFGASQGQASEGSSK